MTTATEQTLTGNRKDREPGWVRGIDVLVRVAAWGSGACVILMGANVVLDVALRNLARSPLSGTNELVTYLWMPCLALLALGYAEIKDEQIRVTLLIDGASDRSRRRQAIVVEMITVVLAAWMTYLAIGSAIHSYEISESTIGATWLLLWPIRVMVVLSFAILTLSAVARIQRIRAGERLLTEIEQEMEDLNDR